MPRRRQVVVGERTGIPPAVAVDLGKVQLALIANALTLFLLVLAGPLVSQRVLASAPAANSGHRAEEARNDLELVETP